MSKKEKDTMLKKRLNINELIANAEKLKERKNETKEFFIKSLKGTVEVKKPSIELIQDSYDMEDTYEADKYVVYESVIDPNFKDAKLQETYGKVGYNVLDGMLDPGEISTLSKLIIQFAGYGDSIEEIKNS